MSKYYSILLFLYKGELYDKLVEKTGQLVKEEMLINYEKHMVQLEQMARLKEINRKKSELQ